MMKINPANVNNIYKNTMNGAGSASGKSQLEEQAPAAKKDQKYDTITISSQGAHKNDISRLASGIAKDVDAAAADEKIESIKAAIRNDRYKVDSQTLADAILKRAKGGFDQKI